MPEEVRLSLYRHRLGEIEDCSIGNLHPAIGKGNPRPRGEYLPPHAGSIRSLIKGYRVGISPRLLVIGLVLKVEPPYKPLHGLPHTAIHSIEPLRIFRHY